jgi:hypothetical protein
MFEQMVASIGQGAVTQALLTVMQRCQRGQVHRFEAEVV